MNPGEKDGSKLGNVLIDVGIAALVISYFVLLFAILILNFWIIYCLLNPYYLSFSYEEALSLGWPAFLPYPSTFRVIQILGLFSLFFILIDFFIILRTHFGIDAERKQLPFLFHYIIYGAISIGWLISQPIRGLFFNPSLNLAASFNLLIIFSFNIVSFIIACLFSTRTWDIRPLFSRLLRMEILLGLKSS
jgi:hypothetical protein